jgi:hypothetical protein
MTLAAGGWAWIPVSGQRVNCLIGWAAPDTAGPAQPPEKRKVGGSTPPLPPVLDVFIAAGSQSGRKVAG